MLQNEEGNGSPLFGQAAAPIVKEAAFPIANYLRLFFTPLEIRQVGKPHWPQGLSLYLVSQGEINT